MNSLVFYRQIDTLASLLPQPLLRSSVFHYSGSRTLTPISLLNQ